MSEQMKKCKHCQTDIPKKAKVCPNCRKKQGNKLGIALIVVGVLIVIGVLGGGDDTSQKPTDSNPQKVDTVQVEEKTTIAESTVAETKNEFKVGDVVETSNLKISFLSASEYVSDNEFITPKDGYMYYRMEFEFENIGDTDTTISSMMNWECYADDYSVDQSWIEDDQIDATISAGKKVKGAVYFEVPKEAKSIVLEYKTNFWTENKVVFIVK